MDNLLTAVLIFYAMAVTILFGIAVYLVYKVDKRNKELSDQIIKITQDDEYVKWKIEKYLDAAKEAIKKGEYLW